MRNSFLILFLLLFQTQYSSAMEIALSFDDAPRRLTGYFSGMERAKKLVKELKAVNVSDAVFYCNSSHINSESDKIIQFYNDAGYTIANHTHSHPSFNKTNFEDYKKDFLKADKFLSKYSNFKKLFRFPYLREGGLHKRDPMRKLLKDKGYQNAYITVDFSDWHLESLLRESIEEKQTVDLNKVRDLYLSLAKESLNHYDSLAKKYLNRSPKHVLLLHETDLAALFIGDLVKAMRSWGWKIISSKEAYTDEISKFNIVQFLKNNPGRVGEIAVANKHPMSDVWAQETYPTCITKRYQNEVIQKNK